MKILVIEDEPLLLEKYSNYAIGLFDHVESCETAESAQNFLRGEAFDVILADHQLPDGDGLDIVANAIYSNPSTVGILITAHSKEKLAIESLNRGVFRYLEKPAKKGEIILSLNEAKEEAKKRKQFQVLEERFLMSSWTRNHLLDEFEVSSRELEVIDAILIYGKNRLVAENLFISEGTVKNHLSHISQKLGISGKDELKKRILEFNQRGEQISKSD